MTVFVDTSALYALLDADDAGHLPASQAWQALLDRQEPLVSNNYVLVETLSLVQSRLGVGAVQDFQDYLFPFLDIEWLGKEEHLNAVFNLLTAGRCQLSLVDCSGFDTMRRLGIRTAFALDPHFAEQGFTCLP